MLSPISTVSLKFGNGQSDGKLAFESTPLTVFVGPNNSGKSKVLNEIRLWCSNGRPDQSDMILDSLTFNGVAQELIPEIIDKLESPPSPTSRRDPSRIHIARPPWREQLHTGREAFICTFRDFLYCPVPQAPKLRRLSWPL
jgi:hypothetical protein